MFNKTGKLNDEDKKFGDFAPIVKGLYVLTVKEATEGETEERVWEGAGFINTGKMVPQLTLKFWCEDDKGNNEILNAKGESIVNPQHTIWINDSNLGWNKKTNKPKQGRAVLAALLGVEVDGDISFDKAEDLIGMQMKAYFGIETNAVGKEKNVLLDISSL
jgi:hypothetical protein